MDNSFKREVLCVGCWVLVLPGGGEFSAGVHASKYPLYTCMTIYMHTQISAHKYQIYWLVRISDTGFMYTIYSTTEITCNTGTISATDNYTIKALTDKQVDG